ncbi:hypothetical protein [Domibacillus epiphyticus]|uniref:Uncharacterized protein n=1 Tax=Domibacillus epiphyticus TaxID=1714355 RepID=A0A1V2A5T1_9BACI|nr:hypothetical protein [Domibacillus epiphyticus]OMP66287.1 hypothetical protein BTO28_12515 [Domibacillus epiphyticus]
MNNSSRFVVNAAGKRGETYYTQCQDKKELKKWVEDNKEKLVIDELKIIDNHKHPLIKWFSFKK